MRKHSPRKWLHAVLDLLPVVLIPVFMIYSHRHTLTERTQVDIQYKYQSNEVNTLDDLVVGNVYHLDNLIIGDDSSYVFNIVILSCDSCNFDFTDYEVMEEVFFEDYDSLDLNGCLLYYSNDAHIQISYSNLNAYGTFSYDFSTIGIPEFYNVNFYIYDDSPDNFKLYWADNISADNTDELPQYTDFNVIESVQVDDTTSSITDVFLDNFTDTVNTKFNFAQMFNFNDIWSWLNTNLFNNISSPLAYAIYNIIIYEFLMDILFIIYALFMFIIDFCECLLEKPFDKVKRG